MATLADCIKKIKNFDEDSQEVVKEIRRLTNQGEPDNAGVERYLQVQRDSLETFRETLKKAGFSGVDPMDVKLEKTFTPEEITARTNAKQDAELEAKLQGALNDPDIQETINYLGKPLMQLFGKMYGRESILKLGDLNKDIVPFINPDIADTAEVRTGANFFEAGVNNEGVKQSLDELRNKIADLIVRDARGRVSIEQSTKEGAQLLKGKGLEAATEELSQTPRGMAFNAAQVMAGKMIMANLDRQFKSVSKQLTELRAAGGDPVAIRELSQKNGYIMSMLANSVRAYGAGVSESARALNAHRFAPSYIKRMNAKLDKLHGAGKKAVDPITGAVMDTDKLSANMEAAYNLLGRTENQLERDLMLANLRSASSGEKITEAWYNAILSNPGTWQLNMIGNEMSIALDRLERGIAMQFQDPELRGIAKVINGMTFEGTTLIDTMKAGIRAFKTELPTDPSTILELEDTRAWGSFVYDKTTGWRKAGLGEDGWGGQQVRIPGRILLGMDEMYKLRTVNRHLRELASEAAYEAQKTRGQKFSQRELEEFAVKFMRQPPKAALEEAREMARILTFTNQLGPAGSRVQQLVDMAKIGDIPIARIGALPFIRTPLNLVKFAGSMLLPMGRTKADLAAGGLRATEAKARLALGWSIFAGAATLASMGLVTGPSSSDANQRNTDETFQKMPWSIKMGNVHVGMNRFDPVATVFMLGSAVPNMLKDINDPNVDFSFSAAVVAALSDAILDKTFFSGIENIVKAVTEPERFSDAYARGVVRSFVPSIVAGVNRAYDPSAYRAQTLLEVLSMRSGFAKGTMVPKDYDGLGREKTYQVVGTGKDDTGVASMVNRFLNPLASKEEETDPVALELKDLRVVLPRAPKKFRDIELTTQQQSIYQKAWGNTMYTTVKYFQQGKNWDKVPIEIKRLMMDEAKKYSTETAQFALYAVYPELVKDAIADPKHNRQLKKLKAPPASELSSKLEVER